MTARNMYAPARRYMAANQYARVTLPTVRTCATASDDGKAEKVGKGDLQRRLAEECDLDLKAAKHIVDSLLNIIVDEVADGKEVRASTRAVWDLPPAGNNKRATAPNVHRPGGGQTRAGNHLGLRNIQVPHARGS